MIQVSHLEKSFEGFRALKGVDMHVEKVRYSDWSDQTEQESLR